MAVLQITVTNVDQGTPTGNPVDNVRRATYALDGVPKDDCVQIFLSTATDGEAAQGERDLLTANGITWTSEDPVIYN